jgi:leader peptidase (prepilin peptidase)/N-methyltransferase
MPRMDAILVVACSVLGLVFGSFANVVIHRVPAGASVVRPPSACPGCGEPVSPRDNVPVASWLVLRGRCRSCGEPIPARYPLVELAGGVLFGLMALRFGLDWALPAFLLFAWTLLAVAVIDARTRRIPNRLTYPLTPALLALLGLAAVAGGDPGPFLRALLGGLAAFTALLGLALVSPRGMGMGDVKLAGFLGIGLGYLGWGEVVLGVFGGFVLGGVVALLLMALRLRGRKDQIPFGPYLAASAILSVLWGRELIDAYLGASGLV